MLQTKPSLPDGKLELPAVSAADSAAYAAGQRRPVPTAGRANGASNGATNGATASASSSSNNGTANGSGPNGAVSGSRQQPGASTSGRAVKLELRVSHSRMLMKSALVCNQDAYQHSSQVEMLQCDLEPTTSCAGPRSPMMGFRL